MKPINDLKSELPFAYVMEATCYTITTGAVSRPSLGWSHCLQSWISEAMGYEG
jgi:hypothetical protein